MDNISITILVAIIGCILSITSFMLGRNRDSEKRGREEGEVKALLNQIIKIVDEIRIDFRAMTSRVDDLTARMVKVEESGKALHRRVDEIEEKMK